MARIEDPQGREVATLRGLVDLNGKRVVEIGCGEGRTTRYISRIASSVLAVDPDEQAVARARDDARDNEDASTFMVADAVTLDLPAAEFDVVVFSRSL